MANLNRLLEQRQGIIDRGQEVSRGGVDFFFSHTNVTGVQSYGPCCYQWSSPGTGVAIVELWGASGSGSLMCCCSGGGIPGNPGAYSKICVNVTPSSVVCGFVGCSPHGGCLCYPGRSQCSVACLLNTSCNNILTAQGGFGGYTNCSTGTAHYCCLVAAGFAHTITNTFCGIICNSGGPNGAVGACACGGGTNVCGGISCLRTWDCCQYHKCNMEVILAVSPGMFSSNQNTCFNFFKSEFPGFGIAHNSWSERETGMSLMTRQQPYNHTCWSSSQPCGCYEHDGCFLNPVGVPGITGSPCPSVRSSGGKGGHGAIRITFYQ
jgi:hypothetical protein